MTRFAALVLTVLTGFSGLVYEVVWQKYVATLLGSHSEATATVLGIFLAGLSLGYALFGALTRRLLSRPGATGQPARLLVVYGGVEAAIGLYALAFPQGFEVVRHLSHAIPHGGDGFGFALDALLVAALLGPPTVLMGGTIPILTQALARDLRDSTRVHALVYGFNAAGAFAGALAGGFVLVPRLGLASTLHGMSAVNLLAGAAFVVLGLRAAGGSAVNVKAEPAVDRSGWIYACVAFLWGFAFMVVQNVAIRLAGLSLGSSEFTFATVVAVFVFSIAAGSLSVSLLRRVPRGLLLANQIALTVLLALLYWPLQTSTYWAHRLRILFGTDPDDFLPFYLACFGAILAALGLPAVLSGATLPLLFDHLRQRLGELGALAGRIYSWNTLGSLAGALLGGYGLLFVLDLHQVYRVAVAAMLVATAMLAAKTRPGGRPWLPAVVATVLLAGLVALPAWRPEMLSLGLFRFREALPTGAGGLAQIVAQRFGRDAERIIFYRDDPVASVAVIESRSAGGALSRSVLSNAKSDGSTGLDYPTMALAGLIPALLAEKAERAFVIGYGTGVTVGELAALESMQRVTTAEISPAVLDAAPLFEFANQAAAANPKTAEIRADAYRALMRSEEDFDIIVAEPSNPWVTGVEMLFSQEFLLAARGRLTPGGVYAQWYHQYEADAESVALVLRTFASVFDRVAIWYALGADLLILGFDDDDFEPSLDALRRRTLRADIQAGLRRARIDDLASLLAHELVPVDVLRPAQLEGPIHTLYHPILNHAAGLAFFRGEVGRLPDPDSAAQIERGAASSLPRRYLESLSGEARERARSRMVREACRHRKDLCGALLAQWTAEDPDSSELVEIRRASRRRGIRFGGAMRPQVIERLARFYRAPDAEGPPVSLERAERATRLFLGYFQYAAPPNAATLAALWRRCQAPEAASAACQQGLDRALALTRVRPGARLLPRSEPLDLETSQSAGARARSGAGHPQRPSRARRARARS